MSSTNQWVVYLVRCADDSLYCGITTDPKRRLDEHNRGIGAKYTRSRRPVSLFASASFPDRSTASKVEHRVKRQPSVKKRDFLLQLAREFNEESCNDAAPPQDADA